MRAASAVGQAGKQTNERRWRNGIVVFRDERWSRFGGRDGRRSSEEVMSRRVGSRSFEGAIRRVCYFLLHIIQFHCLPFAGDTWKTRGGGGYFISCPIKSLMIRSISCYKSIK